MKDLQEFIAKHLDLVFVFALVILPLIFGRRKGKKAGSSKKSIPKAGAGQRDAGRSLEEKVRKFFEQMVESSTPRPVSKSPFPSPETDEDPMAMRTAPGPRKAFSTGPKASVPAGPSVFDPLAQQAPTVMGAHESPGTGAKGRLRFEGQSGDVWKTDPDLMTVTPDDLEAPPAPEAPKEPSRRAMDKRSDEAYDIAEGRHERHSARDALTNRFSVASLSVSYTHLRAHET